MRYESLSAAPSRLLAAGGSEQLCHRERSRISDRVEKRYALINPTEGDWPLEASIRIHK